MFLYDQFFGALRMSGGYYQFQAPQLRVIPLRDAPPDVKRSIGKLIDRVKVEDVDEQMTSEILAKVDAQFYQLYGLSSEERSRVDTTVT
ncbi:MAG TPA: hypothetical protein VG206_07220 [Terriglobia bacterium]|nr:hypothetical protein [Terriglobia bacterium]